MQFDWGRRLLCRFVPVNLKRGWRSPNHVPQPSRTVKVQILVVVVKYIFAALANCDCDSVGGARRALTFKVLCRLLHTCPQLCSGVGTLMQVVPIQMQCCWWSLHALPKLVEFCSVQHGRRHADKPFEILVHVRSLLDLCFDWVCIKNICPQPSNCFLCFEV